MTTDADRTQGLQIDAVTIRKETNADSFAMRLQGSYPANEAHRWTDRLHPARLFALLERDAQREE